MVDFDKVDHAFESNHSFFASVEDMARFLFACRPPRQRLRPAIISDRETKYDYAHYGGSFFETSLSLPKITRILWRISPA